METYMAFLSTFVGVGKHSDPNIREPSHSAADLHRCDWQFEEGYIHQS
jgi:hypothetical protein